MRETTKLIIKNKIFSKKNIEDVGNIFLNEFKNSCTRKHSAKIVFTINCSDNTIYESDSLSIFDNGGIIDIKK
ncbi:hypothetical protein [Caloranaerobacter ferrireducens]|uniref:hypothetical protein n=1 Tax=Caloranaerobacter ferrireducens TaxID=1323370 RepID=UPI00084D9B6A|nr:hypothetical protein [Caloranaerobacter ferrireducens]